MAKLLKNLSFILSALLLMAIIIFILFQKAIISSIGGNFKYSPEELYEGLDLKTRELITKALDFEGDSRVVDFHFHMIRLEGNFLKENTRAFINPKMVSWTSPRSKVRGLIYQNASQINVEKSKEGDYLKRVLSLVKHSGMNPKIGVLGFDYPFDEKGVIDSSSASFFVSNQVVFEVAEKHPQVFFPIVSINPFRKDALESLKKSWEKGARIVKWLPNAMRINPADPKIIPFYETMKDLGMILLSHAGDEHAVEAQQFQKLGNPLLLRLPLKVGVKVIVAHCGSLGLGEDLDDPQKKKVPNFDLFLRLFHNKKYEGQLFGEISAMTQWNRGKRPLRYLLDHQEIHHRLINGSDYPIPAINALISLSYLESIGILKEEDIPSLKKIYTYNPILFDFVLKRSLISPKTGKGFSPSVFRSPFPGIF